MKKRLFPLQEEKESPVDEDISTSSRLIEPNLKYVKSNPIDPSDYFNTENIQIDKGYAVVVAGESGSGKSVFACKQSKESGFLPVYCLVKREQLEKKPPLNKYRDLNQFFQELIDFCDGDEGKDSTEREHLKGRLYEHKFKLNISRNTWAKGVLGELMTEFEENLDVGAWVRGYWNVRSCPKQVAIIVDEATDIDLAEGLVATVRETMTKYRKLAQEPVLLVIAGVGLDAVKDNDSSFSMRVGTNPEYSRLVVMKSPCIEELQLNKAVLLALEKGIFARVLKTNARMLFRSVLHILQMSMHKTDAFSRERDTKRRRYEDRLVQIGSFSPIMDHGPRYYVHWNSVRHLSTQERFRLLLQAFAYHLVESTKKVAQNAEESVRAKVKEGLALIEKLDAYKMIRERPHENIFSLGLASRSGTSSALKYMSTFGLTCNLRSSFGNEFEELSALHFLRVMELQGYETRRVTLKYAWPPKRSKKKLANAIAGLDQILEKQSEDECKNEESLQDVSSENKLCIAFSQGTPTAQGGAVLFLLRDPIAKESKLDSMQCKHWASRPSEDTCRLWWNSIGVDLKDDGTADMEPTRGAAAYSYKGISAFCKLLTKRLGDDWNVTVGERHLVMSFATPTEKAFPVPKNEDGVKVWFREMLEPTISVLELCDPVDYNTDEQ